MAWAIAGPPVENWKRVVPVSAAPDSARSAGFSVKVQREPARGAASKV
ncbi:MAG: hypothetical protein NTV19_12190 [Burkholderiales bacterium]|nr:hypothetical protein [Burkholderiales bacterium]